MNMSMLSLLVVLVVAAVFAGAWFLSLAEAKRLRARNEDLSDRLTDVRLGRGIRLSQKILWPLHRESTPGTLPEAAEHQGAGGTDDVPT